MLNSWKYLLAENHFDKRIGKVNTVLLHFYSVHNRDYVITALNKVRAIAIYLPQFHPIPENDEWWGKGFTEWTNVVKAKPRFEGHYQPHLPSDLGFYDLRVGEVREEQARLAKEHGIYGFCYYHYWFNSRRILERPFSEVLTSGKPDFPFCLCWANENWTRTWDGSAHEILLEQKYNKEDARQHIRHLIIAFKDDRYIKVGGKPLMIIYKPELLTELASTLAVWREEVLNSGFPGLYLAYMENSIQNVSPAKLGFDASIEFQPNWKKLPKRRWGSLWSRIQHRMKIKTNPLQTNRVFDYSELQGNSNGTDLIDYKRFPGIVPMWDNSARRSTGATILYNSTPESYKHWLKSIIQKFKPYSEEENFIFINAWNEWAEGNHLEPCAKWGKAYLEATKDVLK